MKYTEIKNLEVRELQKRLLQTRQALFTARMKHKMKRLSNVMELRYLRRDIARLQFALSLKPVVHVPSKKVVATKDTRVSKKIKPVKKSVSVAGKKLDKKKMDRGTVDSKFKVQTMDKQSLQSKRMDSKPVTRHKDIVTHSTPVKSRLKSTSPMEKKEATSSIPVQQDGLAARVGRLFKWGKKDSKKGK